MSRSGEGVSRSGEGVALFNNRDLSLDRERKRETEMEGQRSLGYTSSLRPHAPVA
jgi:hypothetical protein